MDGIIPTAAIGNAQAQLGQQFAFDAQNILNELQSKLSTGTNFLVQVLGNDKNGNTIVKANGSDLLLSSPLTFAKGAQLQMKIDNVGGFISAQVLTVDGKIPVYRPQNTDGQYQSPKENEQNPIPVKIVTAMPEGTAKLAPDPRMAANNQALAAARVDQVNLSSPQTTSMKAIVISPTPEIMQGVRATLSLSLQSEEKLVKTLPSELQTGMEANVRISGVISEPKPQTAPTTSNAAPVLNAGTGIETRTETESVQTDNTVLKSQDWMKDFSPTIKTSPSGNLQLNALVVDNMREGELLVETKLGLIRVDGKTTFNLPRGTQLQLEVTEFTKTDIQSKTKTDLPSLSHEWPALKALIGDNKPEAEKLAGTERNFGAKLANFMHAVKTGDAETWLGSEFLDQLDDFTRSTLINKLNGDFANLKNLMTENPQSPWQTVLFPVYDGKELNQARLHVKKFKDGSSGSQESYGTRFLVELDTSRYGEMQFDGLVRRQVPKKSFDLMIRTLQPLDAETKTEIMQIFNTTQEITGFKGGIDFASNASFPLEPWKAVLNKKVQHDNLIS